MQIAGETTVEQAEQKHIAYARAAIVILVSIGIILIIRTTTAPSPSLLILPGVLIAGLQWGTGPATFTAIVSSFLWIVLFSPIESRPEITTFLHFVEILAVAILVALLAGRTQRHAKAAQQRQQLQTALRRLSHELAATGGLNEVANVTVLTLSEQMGIESLLFLQLENEETLLAVSSDIVAPYAEILASTAEEPVTRELFLDNPVPNQSFFLYQLQLAGETTGYLGMLFDSIESDSVQERQALSGALTVTVSGAIERELLAQKSKEADLLRRHEELYNAVLSSISHDFRTPLASIIGAAETLSISEGILSRAAKQDMLDMILEEAERLNRFVANLLDMTKLEADRLAPSFEQVEVGDIIGTAVNRAHRILEEFTVEIDLPPQLSMICVDFILIEHVMTNLLENAAKYAPDKGTIRIEARQNEEYLYLSVIDQGKGIPKEELERIFEKFYRVRQGDARTAGTGLGLSICRGIVEAHGGTIRAISPVADGQGTNITISFPLDSSLCRNLLQENKQQPIINP